jgi:hypothetical protein
MKATSRTGGLARDVRARHRTTDRQDDEILVRACAASIHADVWHVMRGVPLRLRFMGAECRPKDRSGDDLSARLRRSAGTCRFPARDAVSVRASANPGRHGGACRVRSRSAFPVRAEASGLIARAGFAVPMSHRSRSRAFAMRAVSRQVRGSDQRRRGAVTFAAAREGHAPRRRWMPPVKLEMLRATGPTGRD